MLPLANQIMHQIPYLRKRWSTNRSRKGNSSNIFHIHASFCVLTATGVLCANLIWIMLNLSQMHVEILRLLICPMSSVDQSLHSQKCHNQEIWNWKLANPKTFMMIHTKIKYSANYWNSQDSDFLPVYRLISCPIESFKSKLGPSAFIPYVAESLNYQNMKVSVFCQRLASLGSTALWGRHI